MIDHLIAQDQRDDRSSPGPKGRWGSAVFGKDSRRSLRSLGMTSPLATTPRTKGTIGHPQARRAVGDLP